MTIKEKIALGFFFTLILLYGQFTFHPAKVHSQIRVNIVPSPTPTPIISNRPSFSGIASYYSRAGCVGCSENFTMADGKPLIDSDLTIAFNDLPLGTRVIVTNVKNGKSVISTVTDTGGFKRLGRIADLTIGTRDAIDCSNLCSVTVQEL
jgi:rare lipoprotein A (peptidoglycan hydrolase)